jgi:GNAT superfamily N-acetyltransferase
VKAVTDTDPPILIRAACVTDDGAIAALLAQLRYAVAPAEVRRRLAVPGIAGHVLVATLGNDIAGLIAYTDPIERLAEGSSFVRITALVVDEKQRAKGIGRRLMAEVERFARERGAALLELTSGRHDDRQAAHIFYPRLGFVDAGHGSVLYRKVLSS